MTNIIVLPATVASDNDPVGTYNQLDRGSDRGSGSWQTNTILRHCDRIFVTWQSYDPGTAHYSVWVGTVQYGTNIWVSRVMLTVPAGYVMDNHGGGSIIADKAGFLHIIFGPHNAPMLEAVSVSPWDASAFHPSTVVPTSPWQDTTYSSVTRDAAGTFHLLYRGRNSGNQWRLVYQRGTTNATTGATSWGTPNVLASTANGSSNTTGYSLYDGTIAVNDRFAVHSIHVAFQLYDQVNGAAHKWGYLRSDDGGNTWKDGQGATVTLPVDASAASSPHLVESNGSIDVRVGNIAISPFGNPWVSVVYVTPSPAGYETKLWHLLNGAWSNVPLSPYMSGFGSNWRVAGATIAFDAQGLLYVAAERVDSNDPTPFSWFAGVSKEIVLLVTPVLAVSFQLYPISSVDPTRPHWLVGIERPTTSSTLAVPSLIYTDGLDTANTNGHGTDIVFVPLYKH
jgi:hypothetical protein